MNENGSGTKNRVARVPVARLSRHRITTAAGHEVGVALAGSGMPLVVAHGFAAQGILYAQTLSRLVSMGFMVVAVDVPGHGTTPLPPLPATSMPVYVERLAEAMDTLGIRRAVLMGHSMGGRLMAELAAERPESAAALILVDAAVGDGWDAQMRDLRRRPVAWGSMALRLMADTLAIADPSDLRQTLRILSLFVGPSLSTRPWRLLPPAGALLNAPTSESALQRLARSGVPTVVINGDQDRIVTMDAARDAAARLGADLVTVRGGHHSWMLNDPETLPAIMSELLDGTVGDAWQRAVAGSGLDPRTATLPEIEEAFLAPNALAAFLAPPVEFVGSSVRRPARFQWERVKAAAA